MISYFNGLSMKQLTSFFKYQIVWALYEVLVIVKLKLYETPQILCKTSAQSRKKQ